MAAQETELELLRKLLGNVRGDELSEAGVDAIGVLALHAVDEFTCHSDPPPCCGTELGLDALDGDRPHPGDGEILPRQDDGRGHSASLERSTRSRIRDSSIPGRSTPAASAAAKTRSGTSPTSSPAMTSVPRMRASNRTRSTTSWTGAASMSITFMLTCVLLDPGSRKPMA